MNRKLMSTLFCGWILFQAAGNISQLSDNRITVQAIDAFAQLGGCGKFIKYAPVSTNKEVVMVRFCFPSDALNDGRITKNEIALNKLIDAAKHKE